MTTQIQQAQELCINKMMDRLERKCMTTIKKWLDDNKFDWESGKILWQQTAYDTSPGWSSPISGEYIQHDNPVLTMEFDNSHGGPQCPRFIAEDKFLFIFPCQYDGATSPVIVMKNLDYYLDIKNESPYPGG